MADFAIKRGDRRPIMEMTLTDEDGPINLTGAVSVLLLMKFGATLVSGACNVISPTTGEITYTWAAGNTATVGDYDAEIEITWATGIVETVPNDTYFSVSVVQDLGGT